MDIEALRRHLSAKDFGRMQKFFGSMTPERREQIMRFMAERETRAPKVGDPAPDFELRTMDGDRKVRLSSFGGSKPVALIFGSFT